MEIWGKKWPERGNLFRFLSPLFSVLLGLKHLSALRLEWRGGERAEAWYAAGPAQESVEPLSLARLPCLFALTSHSLRGYGTCSVKGAIVLQEKSVTNIYHRGNAKPCPAGSQTVKFTTVHF